MAPTVLRLVALRAGCVVSRPKIDAQGCAHGLEYGRSWRNAAGNTLLSRCLLALLERLRVCWGGLIVAAERVAI